MKINEKPPIVTLMQRFAVLVATAILFYCNTLATAQRPDSDAIDEIKAVEALILKNLKRLEDATVCLQSGGGSGSGVIVSEDGLILTAAHVVGNHKTMTVRFRDNRTVTCEVLGTYGPADAAMAKIMDGGPYPFAEIAAAGSLKIGDTVIALGHPGGFDEQRGMPLRLGHVTSADANFYASDAALIQGDSGGPGFNLNGQVVGIHSNITGSVSTNNDTHIDAFHRHWDSLLAGVRKGKVLVPENEPDELVVGLALIADRAGEPLRIRRVAPDSPAEWAGLKAGDQISTVNESTVSSSAEFIRKAKKGEWGRTLKLGILRDDKPITITLELMTYGELQEKKNDQRQPTEANASADAAENKGQDKTQDDEKDKVQDETVKPDAQDLSQDFPSATEARKLPTVHRLCYSPQRKQGGNGGDDQEKSELQKLLEEARKNGGRLKIDPAKLRALNLRLSKKVDKLSPVGGRLNGPLANLFRAGFKSIGNRYANNMYAVIVSGRAASVATAISDQGYLVTKASEIEGRKFQIAIDDGLKVDAIQVAIDRANDLALLKVDPNVAQLQPINLAECSAPDCVKGTICCSVNHKQDALAGFGIVSVAERPLDGSSGALLGVTTEPAIGGLKITNIPSGSPAQVAGLKQGDVITRCDDGPLKTVADLQRLVQSRLPDDEIRLGVQRQGSEFSALVVLGNRSKLAPMAGAREQGLDKVSAKLSRRRWGFARGIQHDGAIRPSDCGGLLVDARGKVIGLNIARAGRIKSFAIPTQVVQDFVQREIKNHSKQAPASTTGTTIQ